MAQISIDIDRAHSLISAYENYLENTKKSYVEPLLSAVEDAGFEGTEKEKIASLIETIKELYKKLDETSNEINENAKTIILRWFNLSEEQYAKYLEDQVVSIQVKRPKPARK